MKKFFCCVATVFIFLMAVAAENSWDFSSTLDFAYYPKTDFVAGGTHFAPITGIYDSLGLRETLTANYKIPLDFGDGALVQGDNVTLSADLVATPISFLPDIKVSFTPVAFLKFEAGTAFGTGWTFIGIDGFLEHDGIGEYKPFAALKTWLYQLWGGVTFMFDTGAIFPGDWNHVVMLASLDVRYWGLLGAGRNAEIFKWQDNPGLTQGGRYDVNLILGYQMPLKLSMVGINFEWFGYFGSPYAKKYGGFNGDFTQIDINPVLQFTITDKDSLFFILNFSSRRSFKEEHSKFAQEPLLNYAGREWFFYMFACRWIHSF